jgi:hypothetical protein
MAITPKPKRIAAPAGVDVEALISKGGSTPGKPKTNEEAALVLRLPMVMIEQIHVLLKARPIKTSRHRWIVEAVHEKLIREG